jgi:hypothetical protein
VGKPTETEDEFIEQRAGPFAKLLRVGRPTAIGHMVLMSKWVKHRKCGLVTGDSAVSIVEGAADWAGKRGLLVSAGTDPSVHILEWRDTGLWLVGSERYDDERTKARIRQERRREKMAAQGGRILAPGSDTGWGGGVLPLAAPSTHATEGIGSLSRVTGRDTRSQSVSQYLGRAVVTEPRTARVTTEAPGPEQNPSAGCLSDSLAVWAGAMKQLRERGVSYGMSWFERMRPVEISNGRLMLEIPDPFFKNWVEDNYGKAIRAAVAAAGGPNELGWVVGEGGSAPEPAQAANEPEIRTLEDFTAAATQLRRSTPTEEFPGGYPVHSWRHPELARWWAWASSKYGQRACLLAYGLWLGDRTFRGPKKLAHWLSKENGQWSVCLERLEDAAEALRAAA